MNEDRRNDRDEDVDLTGIINDYSKDNELRRKIEEMKKQKEGQTTAPQQENSDINPLTGEKFHSSIFDDEKASSIPDIRVDDEDLEKTRVGFIDDTNDKTLVIMNGKKKVTINDGAEENSDTMDTYTYEEEEEDDEELGKTMVKPLSDVRVLDDEEEPLSDDEEDDNDPEDKKMNKVITYVILGVVGILIIAACFFGIKYVMDNFLGSDDKKTEETNKPADKEEEEVNEKEEDPEDITDSTAKKAALTKQKESYQGQLDSAKQKLKDADKAKKEAISTLDSLEKNERVNAEKAEKEANDYNSNTVTPMNTRYEAAKRDWEHEIDLEVKKDKETTMNQLKAKLDEYLNNYQTLSDGAATVRSHYEDEKEKATTKKNEAGTTISSQEKTIKDLESKIADIDKQLADLES